MSKSNLMVLTRDFIKKNFDNLVGKEVEIEVEDRRQKVIIYKAVDDNDDPIDYSKGTGEYFMYSSSDSGESKGPRPLAFIDMSDYRPGAVKINIANPQSGSGRKRKKKSRRMRKSRRTKKTRKSKRKKRRRTKRRRRKR